MSFGGSLLPALRRAGRLADDQAGLDRTRAMPRGAGLDALTKRSECGLRYVGAGHSHRGERTM